MSHRSIWRPSAVRGKRTLVMLHGTGGDENSLLELAGALDPDANVLSVRGNVDEGGANRFFRRLSEGVFDVPDLIRRTDELADFLTESAGAQGFDLSGTFAVGFSNGANIAAALLLQRPEVLAGAILIRAMVPLDPASMPNLVGKHILMLNGDHDPLVPITNAERLEGMFRRYGAETTFELLRAGHDFTRRDLELAQGWLATQP